MSQSSSASPATTIDPVSNVLKWILLAVAVVTLALLGWATFLTYERVPPQPERFDDASGLRGDVVFAVAALLTAWDFLLKLGPLYPRFVERITKKSVARMQPGPGE